MGNKSNLIIIVLSIALVPGIAIPSAIAANGNAVSRSETVTIAEMKNVENQLRSQVDHLKSEEATLNTELALYEKNAPNTQSAGPQLGSFSQYYTDHFIKIFDLQSQIYNSLGDGNIPGCTFKIKNLGNKTITDLEVTAYYVGKNGKVIGQESYLIIGSSNDITNPDYVTLKPDYTYMQDSQSFWSAKSVNASDWDVGNVKIKITTLQLQ